MSSEMLIEARQIIREYFNSAVIVDDELFTNQTDNNYDIINNPLTNDDLGISKGEFGFDSPGTQLLEEVVISVDQYNADEVYNDLLSEGIVTVPWKYSPSEDIRNLEAILLSSKMLVVDWKLVKSNDSSIMGDDSIKLINKFISNKKGLKCAIIYTQENLDEVKVKIQNNYIVRDTYNSSDANQEYFYFEEKGVQNNSLFGFIINKHTKPSEILDHISEVLLKNKSIALHLMDSSMHLNYNIDRAINIFNAPYEKILLTQIMTSDLSQNKISSIINETFLDSILDLESREEHKKLKSDFLFEAKKHKIVHHLQNFKPDVLDDLGQKLKITTIKEIKNLLLDSEFIEEIIELINKSASFRIFKTEVSTLISKQFNKMSNRQRKLFGEFPLIILYLDISEDPTNDFINSFKEQTYNFTKVMKFLEAGENVTTGSIIKDNSSNNYLLCITPLCDAIRPKEINYNFKFLIGEIVTEYKTSDLKNSSKKHYFLSVPIDGHLCMIRWDFYRVKTINLKSTSSYKPFINLKKEYIQNIMNLYTAYQSKAGVDELFYKESDYIDNFIDLIKGRAN
ncbi:response regulator receiver domain [Bacillus inaquosorum]|uniref:response regulator receiver domain n=1 Tax=Bacillus inaquosorum TaxID=483913 RepID=UPI003D206045